MTVRIRAACASDADILLDLIRQHAAYEGSAASITKPVLAGILKAECPPTRIVVAESNQALIGYAAVTVDYALWRGERFAHLDCLFLCEAARGKGIGKKLLHEICRLAQAFGARRVEWQTPIWNKDAIRFYIREGAAGQTLLQSYDAGIGSRVPMLVYAFGRLRHRV